MDIGHRIKKARTSSGYSQREFARRLGVSFGLVGQWENHTKLPGRDNLKKVAALTFTTMEDLMGAKSEAQIGPLRPDQLALLRAYERLPVRSRKKVQELLGVAADIFAVEKQEG